MKSKEATSLSGRFNKRAKEEEKKGFFQIDQNKKRSITDPEVFQNEQQARRANGNHLSNMEDDEDAGLNNSGSFGIG